VLTRRSFRRVSIFLEEAGVPYSVVPVNIGKGEQFDPSFLQFSPNNRIPAIRDVAPADGGEPIGVFESGAILQYLSAKYGKFGGSTPREIADVNQWLFWQMGGVGPMFGQYGHFAKYATEKIPYAIDRYAKEAKRLIGVLDTHLARSQRQFVAGAFSIADMALYPWIAASASFGIDLAEFPAVHAWVERIRARPSVQKVESTKETIYPGYSTVPLSDEQKKILFGQTHKKE
jgi:GST-like protein